MQQTHIEHFLENCLHPMLLGNAIYPVYIHIQNKDNDFI